MPLCSPAMRGLAQGFELLLAFLQQAQTGMDHLACGTVASGLHLAGDESLEVFPEGDAGVLAHVLAPPITSSYHVLVILDKN